MVISKRSTYLHTGRSVLHARAMVVTRVLSVVSRWRNLTKSLMTKDQERYFQGGYDSPCSDCGGSGKVLQVDEEEFKRSNPEMYSRWSKWVDREISYERQCSMERKMGA